MAEELNLFNDVEKARLRYGPKPNSNELFLILNEVAWKNRDKGLGFSSKPHETHIPGPNGVMIAHDILQVKGTQDLYDVLIAAGERADPTWNKVAWHNDSNRIWLAPVFVNNELTPISSPGEVPNDDTKEDDLWDTLLTQIAESNRLLLESNIRVEKQLEGLRSDVIKSVAEFGKLIENALKGGGLFKNILGNKDG